MSRNSLLLRVRQVSSPHKMARARLERVQKINKVSKSLFGPVIKSEFERWDFYRINSTFHILLYTFRDPKIQPFSYWHRFAQMEMAKYQLQAANKWSFDFVKESPIRNSNSQFSWETVKLAETPKFYHHEFISHQNDCENIWPLVSLNSVISSPALVIQDSLVTNNRKIAHSLFTSASSSFATSTNISSVVCNKSQRKITGKRRKFPPNDKTLDLITPKSASQRQLILIKY